MTALAARKRVKHCLGGKLSVGLALLGVAAALGAIVVARKYVHPGTPVRSALSVGVYVAGLVVAPALFLLGTLAGIFGLFSRTRKRVLAVVGTLFCGSGLILVATWIVLLMVAGRQG